MTVTKDIERAVAIAFRRSDRRGVIQALQRFRYREKSRVQRAILVLAEGDPEMVETYVDQANGDYRDPLFWAEYPNIAGTGTKAEMAKRYRALGFKVPEDLKVKSRLTAQAKSRAKCK